MLLALQGAFAEHKASLHRLNLNRQLNVILVRVPEELSRCDALIIPGGGGSESCVHYKTNI